MRLALLGLAAAALLAPIVEAQNATTQEVTLAGIRGEAPAAWRKQSPTGEFRLAQFVLPRSEGDAADGVLIVYYFGEGGGGTLEDNLARWYSMMVQPDGKPSKDAAKVAKVEGEGVAITTVDLAGTYLDKPFPAAETFTRRPGYRLFAAMVATPGAGGRGPYWIRAVGPAKTMADHAEGWQAFVKSLRR